MSNTAKNNTSATPADVAKVEENKKVPTQSAPEATETVTVENPAPEVEEADTTEQDEPTKSFSEKLNALSQKLAQKKKALAATALVVGVATVALVKYVKTQAEEILDENDSETFESTDNDGENAS